MKVMYENQECEVQKLEVSKIVNWIPSKKKLLGFMPSYKKEMQITFLTLVLLEYNHKGKNELRLVKADQCVIIEEPKRIANLNRIK